MTSLFRPREEFHLLPGAGYRLLPFRFMRWDTNEVLVVNEVGEYMFLDARTFEEFAFQRLSPANPAYQDLKAKHFLFDSSALPVELLATKFRTKKSFLEGFTRL